MNKKSYSKIFWSKKGRAKNWRSHGCQWRVKTDQGHQKLKFECPMCDYATEFRKSCNINYAKYKVKNKTQYVILLDYLYFCFFAWTLRSSILAIFLVLKCKFRAVLTVISRACFFLFVNTLLKAMGHLFKCFYTRGN